MTDNALVPAPLGYPCIEKMMNGADRLYEESLKNPDSYQAEVSIITPSNRPGVEYILMRREHAEYLMRTGK